MKATKTLMLAGVASAFVTLANAQAVGQATPAPSAEKQAAVAPAAPKVVQRIFIAINKFDDTDGSSADKAAQLRKRVQHRIIGTRKFEVVEREDLPKVLDEARHSQAGLTDPTISPQLKAAGYVVYGTLLYCDVEKASAETVGLSSTREKFRCELQLKITDCETGVIKAETTVVGRSQRNMIAMSNVKVTGASSGNPLQREAMDEAAAFAVDVLRALAYPSRIVRTGARYATANLTSTEVRHGELFDVFADGGEMRDPDTGAFLGREGEYVGRVKVAIPGEMTTMMESADGLPISRVRVGSVLRRLSRDTPKPVPPRPPSPFDGK